MSKTKPSGASRQPAFISHPSGDQAEHKALFERQVLRLLSMRAEDYVATLDTERVLDAFVEHAAPTGDEREDEDYCAATNDQASGDPAGSADYYDVVSRLAARNRTGSARAPASEILEGAHNAQALSVGRELVEVAARRPPRGIRQVVSGKGGSGKTELLVHLACFAHHRAWMNVAVIDLAASAIAHTPRGEACANITDADLVLIDNAHCTPPASRQSDWWEELEQQLRKSACVVAAVTPDAIAAADAPWQRHSDAWRKTEIGSFDCDLRRALTADLARRQQEDRGGPGMSDAAVKRLAEELWGNGWQLAEGVEACSSFASVMAREPRPEEIDEIAANVGATNRQAIYSPAAFWTALERGCELAPLSKEQQHELALYITRAITGQPLESIGKHYGLERDAAVRAIMRVERSAREDGSIRRVIAAVQSELDGNWPDLSGTT